MSLSISANEKVFNYSVEHDLGWSLVNFTCYDESTEVFTIVLLLVDIENRNIFNTYDLSSDNKYSFDDIGLFTDAIGTFVSTHTHVEKKLESYVFADKKYSDRTRVDCAKP